MFTFQQCLSLLKIIECGGCKSIVKLQECLWYLGECLVHFLGHCLLCSASAMNNKYELVGDSFFKIPKTKEF